MYPIWSKVYISFFGCFWNYWLFFASTSFCVHLLRRPLSRCHCREHVAPRLRTTKTRNASLGFGIDSWTWLYQGDMEDGWKDSYSIGWSWSGVVSHREYRAKHFLHLVAGYHSSIRVSLETFEAKTVQYKALSIVASHECKSSMILWPRDPHYNRPSEPRQHHPSQGHRSHPSRCAIGAVTLATALLRDRRGAKMGGVEEVRQ